MLQVARLAPQMLGKATPLVADFLHGLANPDGGYSDRNGKSDLYYSSFAVSGLVALQEPLPIDSLGMYIAESAKRTDLDLVHMACLGRIWSLMPKYDRPRIDAARISAVVEAARAADGGYNTLPQAEHGTLYGCFLALGLYEDLSLPLPRPEAMVRAIRSLRTPDGGYANSADLPVGLTTTSAAAASLLRHLAQPTDAELAGWLLSRLHPDGGFVAASEVPIPDLLSTATALHALCSLKVDLQPLKDACLDFLDTLWTARGGFYGSWEDDHLDCEYTYYGLLALGHLSL